MCLFCTHNTHTQAGVTGTIKYAYHLFGDTVNTSARMETNWYVHTYIHTQYIYTYIIHTYVHTYLHTYFTFIYMFVQKQTNEQTHNHTHTHSPPMRIQLSPATVRLLRRTKMFVIEPREKIAIKGKGDMMVYYTILYYIIEYSTILFCTHSRVTEPREKIAIKGKGDIMIYYTIILY